MSDGNALGIGFADFIPASLANQLDFRKTYINCFTAGPAGMRRTRMPMVLPDEESCIKAALSMCGRGPDEPKRVVRIDSDAAPHRVSGQQRTPPLTSAAIRPNELQDPGSKPRSRAVSSGV